MKWLVGLARRYRTELGFIPANGLAQRVEQGQVSLSIENGEPAAFLLSYAHVRPGTVHVPIYQAACAMDAQRRHHGLNLLANLAENARLKGKFFLQAWCRRDLESNAFWRAAGFLPIALHRGGRAAREPVLLWRKPLIAGIDLTPKFWSLPGRAGHQRGLRWDLRLLSACELNAITTAGANALLDTLKHMS